jgi:two-component system nitrate/nitrite response regulator NarL
MQDIFVSTLPKFISGWVEAFPDALLVKDVLEISSNLEIVASYNAALIFWLHINNNQNNHQKSWLTDAITKVLKSYPNAKVVVLANRPSHAESLQALSAGAMGYAHTYSPPEMLNEIRSVVSHGGIWLGQQLLKRLIETSVKLAGNKPEFVEELLQRLTKREQQVALEAAKGLSNKEIARVLEITERTVKAHLAATFERLGAKDRLQLALMLNKK